MSKQNTYQTKVTNEMGFIGDRWKRWLVMQLNHFSSNLYLFMNEARQLSQYLIQSTTSSRLSDLSATVPCSGKPTWPGPLALLTQDPSVKTAYGEQSNQLDLRWSIEVRFGDTCSCLLSSHSLEALIVTIIFGDFCSCGRGFPMISVMVMWISSFC